MAVSRLDLSSPEGIVKFIQRFYLALLVVGLFSASLLGGLVGIFLNHDYAFALMFAGLGVAMFIVGIWMRRALSVKNPKAWQVHAVLGPLCAGLFELVLVGNLWYKLHLHQSSPDKWLAVAFLVYWTWALIFQLAPIHRKWMSPEVKLWFGIEK